MKANTILQQLQRILPLAQGNKIIPILSTIKFDGNDTFTTSDTRDQMSVTIKESGLDKPFCVDAVKFTNIIRGYGDKEVSFKLTDTTIEIKADKSKYKLPILPADDFIEVNSVFSDKSTVDGVELNNAIKATSFATSIDDLRPAMSGLFFDTDTVASTDAQKMVAYSFNHGFNFILPVSAFNILSSNLSDFCDVSESNSHIKFETNNVTLISRKIEEKFPPYKAVIPQSNSNRLTIETRKFEDVVKRLLMTADANTSAIVLDLSTECKAYSNDKDFGVDGIEELTCKYDGEGLKIAFNGKFLLECLRSISDKEVVFELDKPNRMGLFNCVGKKVVIAPVVVNF